MINQLVEGTLEHLVIVFIAILISTVLGIFLGVVAYWVRFLDSIILWFAEIMQTIPSLALLALLMIVFGLGDITLIAGLVLYALLPIVRNTYTGLKSVPSYLKDAAHGMGMSNFQKLIKVELHLSFPLIFSGIKIALVNSLSVAVMGVLIGANGLGTIIYRGIQSRNVEKILIGAIPVVIMALIFDYFMSQIENRLLKKVKHIKGGNIMKLKKKVVGLLLIAVMSTSLLLAGCSNSNTIVVGSKDFSENILLGEMFAQLIEEHTELKVDRKLNLGGTFVCFEAIKKGDIDVYPEYTGTGLTAQLEMNVISDPEETYRIVSEEFNKQFQITWLSPLGFNNTYAIAVTDEVYQEYGIETVSELAKISDGLIFGAEHEFFDREDGFDGLTETYNMKFKGDAMKMDVSLKYQAIGNGDMDVTDAFSTDGAIKQYNLKVLTDDLGFFPPYYAAPIVRNDVLEKHPVLKEALNKLSGIMNDEVMTELNHKVDVLGEDVDKVAKEYLQQNDLVN